MAVDNMQAIIELQLSIDYQIAGTQSNSLP
jgi:hypothetical protein